jgi:hypothetical protein
VSLGSRIGHNRKSIHKLGLLFLFLCPVTLCSQSADNDALLAKFTRAQLQAAIEQTKNEETRLEGLHELIRMAGLRLYEGSMVIGDANPDRELFQLRGEAKKAVAACRDMSTVGKALDSPYRSVRVWAVLSFESRAGYTDPWRPLVPKLVEKLTDPDAGVRMYTVDRLRSYPEGAQAIAKHTPMEMDPEVLLRIAGSGSSPDFYRSLVRLLSSTDAKVRESALFFIYFNLWNKATAPMWRLGVNQEVYEQVQALSRSPSQKERESALKALSQLDLLKQAVAR